MATLTRDQKIAKAKAYTAARTTPLLVQALTAIGPQIDAARAKAGKTKADADYLDCEALNMSRMWMIEALEARYPAVVAVVSAALDADEDADYDAVFVAAVLGEAVKG